MGSLPSAESTLLLGAAAEPIGPHGGSPPRCRYLNNNKFSGALPPEWAQANAFLSLLLLRLDNNNLSGPLPEIPAEGTAFPSLQVM